VPAAVLEATPDDGGPSAAALLARAHEADAARLALIQAAHV
jgi:hypothetical protein